MTLARAWSYRSWRLERRRDLADLLRGTHLFGELDDGAFTELVGVCSVHEVKRGAYVMREGDAGEAMHVIVAGAFEVRAERAAVPVRPRGPMYPGD